MKTYPVLNEIPRQKVWGIGGIVIRILNIIINIFTMWVYLSLGPFSLESRFIRFRGHIKFQWRLSCVIFSVTWP